MRRGFTLLELIIAAAILAGVMAVISMSLRSASRVATAIDLRGDLNAQAWNSVRLIAEAVRNAQVTSVDTTNGIIIFKTVTDLSGATILKSATPTTVSRVTVTVGGRTYKRLEMVTGTLKVQLAQEVATKFIATDNVTLPKYFLNAPSYPGFLIAKIGNMVVIGVTLEQQDPSGAKASNGSPAQFRATALTQVMLRNF